MYVSDKKVKSIDKIVIATAEDLFSRDILDHSSRKITYWRKYVTGFQRCGNYNEVLQIMHLKLHQE